MSISKLKQEILFVTLTPVLILKGKFQQFCFYVKVMTLKKNNNLEIHNLLVSHTAGNVIPNHTRISLECLERNDGLLVTGDSKQSKGT